MHLKVSSVKCRPFSLRPDMLNRVAYSGKTLQWRHDERDGVSNHRRLDCLFNRLFRHRSVKTSKFASLAFVRGIHRFREHFNSL